MDSGSQTDIPHKRSSDRLANLVGTLIALLTLILPIITIAYFSPNRAESWQPSLPIVRSGD